MKIVVCVKQVPDTNEVKIDPKTGTLIRDGVPSIINPDDKNALEGALQLKDTYGGHVTVITMGPPQAKVALEEALAMGADEAILVTDRAFAGADTLATSHALAAAIKNLDYDIRRAWEDGYENIRVNTPVLLTAIETLNVPRYMNIKNIFAMAKEKEVKVWTVADINVDVNLLGLKGSPTKVKKSMTKEAKGQGEIFEVSPKEAASIALSKLKEKHFI